MKIPVFHSYGDWGLSGVNTWTVNMIRGSADSNYDHRVLFTGIAPQPKPELDGLGIPYDFLDLPAKRTRREEWRKLKRFLEDQAPCIYIPNYDFHRSCAVGTLSPSVKICAVIHSDEACYFDEVKRLGDNFDAIVAVSEHLAGKLRLQFPNLAPRITNIPYGIPLPEQERNPRQHDGFLRLAYCNRLQQYQKRVFDLPPLASELKRRGVPFELTVAGEGPDEAELRQMFVDAGIVDEAVFLGRIPNKQVLEVFRRSHVFLLTSDFEGLPISLLEAMSVGCVPVAYETPSGIGEAIEHGKSGMMVPHGEIAALADVLDDLSRDHQRLGSLGEDAGERVRSIFALGRMCADYATLFERLLREIGHAAAPIRTGRVRVPDDLTFRSRAAGWLSRRLSST